MQFYVGQEFKKYYLSRKHIPMAKEKTVQKDVKKVAEKSLKEKRADKKAKKESKK
jgi:hypothetical protein